MITHDQMIFTIQQMLPQITPADHGTMYWVGMPVEGNTQTADARIYEWNFTDITEPTQAAILAKWADPAVQAAYAASIAPPPNTKYSTLDYFNKFTDAEYQAARTGTMALQRGLDMLIAAQYVDVADPRVAQYLTAMQTAGIITAARQAQLLTPPTA